MRALTARTVYCVGLLVLTACAVLPPAAPASTFAINTARPQSIELRLAQAIRDRIGLQQSYGEKHPALIEARAMEAALRDLAFGGNPTAARRELISALANELSDAMADRTRLSLSYGSKYPEMQKIEAVISGLTLAINAEVHGRRA